MSVFSSGGAYYKSETVRLLKQILEAVQKTDTSTLIANNEVSQSATSVTLAPENTADRSYLEIRNVAAEDLYVSYVSPATTDNATHVLSTDETVLIQYTGPLYGIWSGAGASQAVVTELKTKK